MNECEQVAPTIGIWVAADFPGGTILWEAQIQAIVKEAADAARSDSDVETALEWTDVQNHQRVWNQQDGISRLWSGCG